ARRWLGPLVKDLQNHRGAGVVIAGDGQPPYVHALAHAMNRALGNAGKTVVYTDPVEARPTDQTAGLRELVQDVEAARVAVLLVVGGTPASPAPAALGWGDALAALSKRRTNKDAHTAHLGLYQDETAVLCQWHVPEAHYLESWGDARAYDGTASI